MSPGAAGRRPPWPPLALAARSPLADRDTYFAGGAEGYTNYPAMTGSYY